MVGLLAIEAQGARSGPDFLFDVGGQVDQVSAWQRPQLSDRVAAIKVTESTRHQIAHLFGDGPVAGNLAPDDGDDAWDAIAPRMVVQRVFSGNLAFGDMFNAHERADTRPGVVDFGKTSAGECALGFLDQVVDVVF